MENDDCLFDDGVAPELALDFDSQHISSVEALASWAAALTGLGLFYTYLRIGSLLYVPLLLGH